MVWLVFFFVFPPFFLADLCFFFLWVPVGSVVPAEADMWVLDEGAAAFTQRKVTLVPGLYKIFDEILVNAVDQMQRNVGMSRLDVDIDVAKGSIRVWNNGAGVPVAMHAEHGMYVPEMIFGHLLTSSNYDDAEKKGRSARACAINA